jgi:hypothetical protein
MTSGVEVSLGFIWHATKSAGTGLGNSEGEGCRLGVGVGEAVKAEGDVLPRTRGPLAVQADPITSMAATLSHARRSIRRLERAAALFVT